MAIKGKSNGEAEVEHAGARNLISEIEQAGDRMSQQRTTRDSKQAGMR